MIISTKGLQSITGKLVTFLLRNMNGILVVMILKAKEIADAIFENHTKYKRRIGCYDNDNYWP